MLYIGHISFCSLCEKRNPNCWLHTSNELIIHVKLRNDATGRPPWLRNKEIKKESKQSKIKKSRDNENKKIFLKNNKKIKGPNKKENEIKRRKEVKKNNN